MTFYEEIVAEIGGQVIEAIVVGKFQRFGNYCKKDGNNKSLFDVPLQLSDVKELLDYEYDSGYGDAECHPVYIYVNDYIYFISEYDGSTELTKIPRDPCNTKPRYF